MTLLHNNRNLGDIRNSTNNNNDIEPVGSTVSSSGSSVDQTNQIDVQDNRTEVKVGEKDERGEQVKVEQQNKGPKPAEPKNLNKQNTL